MADIIPNLISEVACLGKGFPCGEDPITLVSLSLACSGLALVMVFYLVHKVSEFSCDVYWCSYVHWHQCEHTNCHLTPQRVLTSTAQAKRAWYR